MKTIKILTIPCMALLIAELSAQSLTTDLQNFDGVKVYDLIQVTLIKSNENKAVVSGDNVNEVKIVNNDGKLKIRMELDMYLDGDATQVKLYHTQPLSVLDANEGAQILSDKELNATYLILNAQEGGLIDIPVNSFNLDIKAVTGGKVRVQGKAPNLDVLVRSGAKFNGKKLQTKQAEINLFAGGNASVNADEYVKATVTAGGTIEVYGNPDSIQKKKTFGGSIIVRQ
ncbi:head GIN domain-containing protein [Croceitalea dokdonensis]|nr:head GIN domain-containing protein [Croceitalea dokdonensis]